MSDIVYDGGVGTTISGITVTGTLEFTTAGTYTIEDCTINEVTNTSGGAITLLKAGTTAITTNTGPNITIQEPSSTVEVINLTSTNVQILDDGGVVYDREVNFTGTYSLTLPLGATGTWSYCINRAGYDPLIGTFGATGNDLVLGGDLPKKLQPDGNDLYSGSSSAVLSIVPHADGSRMNVRVGDGAVSSQVIFDEVEDALQTEDGMSFLMNGGGEVSFANLPTGIFVFMGSNVRLIRDNAGDSNATVNAFVQSTDGVVIDDVNGPILFVTVTDADKVSAHQGSVWVDTGSPNSGTTFPTGTPALPVNNLTDAVAIANDLSLVSMKFQSTVTINEDLGGFRICPGGGTQTLILGISGNVQGSVIEEFFVTGQQNGSVLMRNCSINNLHGLSGTYRNVGFGNTFSVAPSAVRFNAFDCYSIVAGDTKPECDMTGVTACGTNIRNWSGGFQLNNATSVDNDISIDVVSGSIKIDASVTEGDIVVRGIGIITDESTGNATVNTAGFNPNMEASEMHTVLDTYANKDDWKADVSNLPTEAQLNIVNQGIKRASIIVPHTDDI
jgi:hypothetical protein